MKEERKKGELPKGFENLSNEEKREIIRTVNQEREELGIIIPNKKKNKNKEEIINTSFYNDEEILAEQIRTNNGKTKYCIYNKKTKEITIAERFSKEGIIYEPHTGEEVQKGYVGLPSEPEDYGTTQELLITIQEFINRWVDLQNPLTRTLTPYNILKSWVFQRFHTINYNRFLGEHGTGKSRALDVVGGLHYKPISTSGALTSAVLFRIINKWGGTIIVDEADQTKSDESQDIIKILNQGYEANRPVMRCDPNDHNVQFFDTYCPKVIATRREFEDKALESRCITEVMVTTSRKDIPPNINEEFHAELLTIRNKLLKWRFDNYDTIDPEVGKKIDLGEIEPRLRQVSTGFATMLADNPEELEHFKTYLQKYQKELRSSRAATPEGRIITAIAELQINGHQDLTAQTIIEQGNLLKRDGSYWHPRAISSYMKTLGFGTAEAKRVNGVMGKYYGFDNSKVFRLLNRFCDDDELIENYRKKCYHVTDVTVVTEAPNFKKTPIVTVTPPFYMHGNNSNTVTDEICEHGLSKEQKCLFCEQKKENDKK